MCFFWDIRPIEELQGSSSSPRREEVDRRTLRDYGGFLLPFFYRERFRESTSTTRKRRARNMYLDKTPIASGVEESNSPRRALLLLLSNSPGGHHPKKNSNIFHGVITTCLCFFSIIPRIEELQDPNSSPRREEDGRRTLRGCGGLLPPFFCRASFTLVNSWNLAR